MSSSNPVERIAISFMNWLLVFVVLGLIGYCWAVFCFLICVPLFYDYNILWPISYLIVFHILLILVLISYFRAIFTKSKVPSSFSHQQTSNHSDEDSLLNSDNSSENNDNSKKGRFCGKCNRDKPDRSHHCSRCETCILKMDHHCPWINNCVGWNNYKYFILFTTYTFLFCITGVIMSIPVIVLEVDWGDIQITDIIIFSAVFIASLFALILFSFIVFSLNNLTTIESMEKHFSWGSSPYDIGAKKNWIEVFGKNPLLWFLPVNTLVHEGYYFQLSPAFSTI